MPREIKPTDDDYEACQGRIKVWLSKEQMALIVDAACDGRGDKSESVAKQWADIQFRLMAAAHKSGISLDLE